jgi:hypothetical protein
MKDRISARIVEFRSSKGFIKFKATLLLALVFIGLGLYLYLVEFPKQEKQEAEAEKAGRVFSFNPKEVSGLIVQYPNLDAISLAKGGDGKWRMTRPLETPANRAVINKIIGLTGGLEFERVVAEGPSDLRGFGLDPPQISVSLKFPDNEERLLIGDDAPASSAYYIKKPLEARVLLMGHRMGDLKSSLEEARSVHAWRKKEVAEFDSDKLDRIRLDFGSRVLVLVKEGSNWMVREPLHTQADRLAVDGLVQTVSGLTAEDFIDDKKAEQEKKFGPPRVALTLGGGSESRNIKFYRPAKAENKDDRFYAVSSPDEPIYVLKGKGLETLLQKDLYALRDKTVLNIDRPAVHEIRIQSGPDVFSLFRDDDGWRMDDRKTEADRQKVAKLMDDLELMKAQKFLDDKPKDLSNLSIYGLSEPQRQIAFYDKDKKLLGKLYFGKEQEGLIYAKNDSRPSVVLVKKSVLEAFRSKDQFIRKS